MSGARRYLFVTLSNIGDAIMTTPALEALHAHDPQARIDLLADRRSSSLFDRCPYRGEVFLRDKRAGLAASLRLLRTLRRTRYTALVDLRTHVLGALVRAEHVYSRRGARPAGPHAVEQHFAVVRPLVGAGPIPTARVWLEDGLRAQARARVGSTPGMRLLALGPGANWPGKIWPAAHYRALVAAVSDRFDGVVLLGSAAEHDRCAALAAALALPVSNLAGDTDLLQAAAILAEATAFVGNDSGLGHLAAAVATPTLVVFGSGRPDRYRPWGVRADWIGAPDQDLASLGAAPVAERLRALLSAPPGRDA